VEILERDVANVASSATCSGDWRWVAAEHLDTSTILSIAHIDVADVDILHDVSFLGILSQRPDRNSMRPITIEIVDIDIRRIWLEGHAIVG
jgi:hypothetical protein